MRYPKAIQHHSTSAQYPSYYCENTIQSLGAIQSHLQVFHMMKWHCGSNTTCNAQESFVWPFQFSVKSHSKQSVLHLCSVFHSLYYCIYITGKQFCFIYLHQRRTRSSFWPFILQTTRQTGPTVVCICAQQSGPAENMSSKNSWHEHVFHKNLKIIPKESSTGARLNYSNARH